MSGLQESQKSTSAPNATAPTGINPEELWKPVVGFEGSYEVSNMGRVRSLDREWVQEARGGTFYLYKRKGQMLKPGPSGGYPSVVLGRNNTRLVHRLVAEAFIGPYPEGQEVRHKDGTRANPCLYNLEYGTRSQNIEDEVRQGTFWARYIRRRKIPSSEHEAIKTLYETGLYRMKDIAELYGVKSEVTILHIIRGRKHKYDPSLS